MNSPAHPKTSAFPDTSPTNQTNQTDQKLPKNSSQTHAIILEEVTKSYRLGQVEVPALQGVNLRIEPGEFTVIAGPSGSGKTTLLNLIGCVDQASSGRVIVAGRDTGPLSDRDLTDLRLRILGFIFQSFNLIPVLNVLDNVEFPLLLQRGLSREDRRKRVDYFLDRVGLSRFQKHLPSELSGGQRQRVAIARALVTKPQVVLADEPTANLDSTTGQSIIDLMKEINRTEKTSFLFSTHDHSIMKQARRVVRLLDGKIVSDETSPEQQHSGNGNSNGTPKGTSPASQGW